MSTAERSRVCDLARSYVGTPYHNRGMIKGVGVDCATLLIKVYGDAGLIDSFDPGSYSAQWFLHRGEELYLEAVLQRSHEIEVQPGPGDLVLYRVGRLFAHGAIVLDWPLIVHADKPAGMVCLALGDNAELADTTKHPRRFFSLWD